MRLLRCFGEKNNDWLHKNWNDYGIDAKHGKIIIDSYTQWMDENGIKIADFTKKQFKCEREKAKYEPERAKYIVYPWAPYNNMCRNGDKFEHHRIDNNLGIEKHAYKDPTGAFIK